MFMRNAEYLAILAAGLFFLASTNSYTQTPNLGMPIDEQDIAAWDIDILPDGTGLPLGQGTAGEGKIIYEQKCAVCHGVNGEGGISPALAGGDPLSNGIDTGKTIGNFWPFAPKIFDYIKRAKRNQDNDFFSDNEVYGLTGYLLKLNNLFFEEFLDKEKLSKIIMPNKDNFISDYY